MLPGYVVISGDYDGDIKVFIKEGKVIKYFSNHQGGRGHLTVNYTGSQSFIILFVGLKTLGTLIKFWLIDSNLQVYKLFNQ